MKKRAIGVVLAMSLLLGISVQAFATEPTEGKDVKGDGSSVASISITNEIITQEDEPTTQPRYPGLARVISAKVYAADSTTMQYYSGYYTSMTPQSSSYCNGTLGAKTAELYKSNNCDSFYVQVTVDKSTASFYETYDNNVKMGEGYCGGGSPNTYLVFSMLIKNNNPGNWDIILKDMGETRGINLWGFIHMP